MSTLADVAYGIALVEIASVEAAATTTKARGQRPRPVDGGKPIDFLRSLVPAACPTCGTQGVTDAGLRPSAKRCPDEKCSHTWGVDAAVYGFTPELPAEGVVFNLGCDWTLTGERGEERPQWLVTSPKGDTASLDAASEHGEVLGNRGRSTRIPAAVLARLDRYADTLAPVL